jgi:hypothetical protein
MDTDGSGGASPNGALGTPWDAVLSLVYFVAMPLLCHLVLMGSIRVENRFSRGSVRPDAPSVSRADAGAEET